MKFDIEIEGIAPLLMHKFSEEMITKIKAKSGDKKLDEDEKREQAKQFAYFSKGKLVQPAMHIEGALIKAATELKLSGSGKKTYKDLMKAAAFVSPEMIPHENQDWTVDSRAVVNPTTRGRSMCYRPRLDKWKLAFQLEVLDERADANAIKEILTISGLRNGIGSYRPKFGRFTVIKFKEIK